MKNTSWLLFEQVFRMVLSLVVTSLTARYLGTEQFGMLQYSMAYILLFSTIGNLGIDSILVNEMMRQKDRIGQLLGTTIMLRMIMAVLSFIGVLGLFMLTQMEPLLYSLISLQALSLVFIVFDSIEYWFQAKLQSKYVVLSKSIAFLFVSIWRLALIYWQLPLIYFAFATVIEAILMALLLVYFYRNFAGPRLHFSFETAKQLLQASKYFFVAGGVIMLYTQLDKIMLGYLKDTSEVGIYTAAMTISSMWMFIPLAFVESARPLLVEAKAKDEKSYLKKTKQLFRLIIWLGIVASVFISLFSKPLIYVIYGANYMEAVAVLIVLIWSRIFAMIGTIKALWLTLENLGKYQIYFVVIAAVLNIVFNVLLISPYGAVGAAISTLLAEMISAFFAVLFFSKTKSLFRIILDACLLKK